MQTGIADKTVPGIIFKVIEMKDKIKREAWKETIRLMNDGMIGQDEFIDLLLDSVFEKTLIETEKIIEDSFVDLIFPIENQNVKPTGSYLDGLKDIQKKIREDLKV